MLKSYLNQVIAGQDLSKEQAAAAMEVIMSGAASDAQIGSFLTALKMKGEAIDEIAGFAKTPFPVLVVRDSFIKIFFPEIRPSDIGKIKLCVS